jgi:hypothetical protein
MATRVGNVVITILTSSCDFSQNPVDLAQLIIDCIFLLIFLFIIWFWLRVVDFSGPEISRIFPWHCFEIALLWALVYGLSFFDSVALGS